MASAPPEDNVNKGEDEFEKAFNEFAAEKNPAPDVKPDPDPAQPEAEAPAGDEPAPELAPAPAADESASGKKDEPPAPAPAPAEEAPDPWASLSPELKAQVEQLRQERDAAQQRAKSDANRVAALSRKLYHLQANGSATSAPPQEKKEEPTEAQKALDEKVKKLREEYPDVAEPLIEMIEAQRAELSAVSERARAVDAEQHSTRVAEQFEALEKLHPDWREVAESEAWGVWLAHQPPGIQTLAQSWDARETSTVLTLFKNEQASDVGQKPPEPEPKAPDPEAEAAAAATDARRARQLEGGQDVRSKPAPAASGAPDGFEDAFKHFAAKKEQQLVRR